ncbi:DUF6808 domain-containing protein [Sphingobacterium paludis]|nr:hypothetical protein [Sphingobacterium paludis]
MLKNIIIALLAFIVIAFMLNSFFGLFTGSKNDMIAKETLNPQTDSIPLSRVKTPTGANIVTYQPREGILPENHITGAYKTYVQDTLAPALKMKASDISDPNGRIKELVQVNASVSGQLNAALTEIDSLKRMVTYFQGRYFSASVRKDTTGLATLVYNYNAKLDLVTEQRRAFFKDYLVTHISSPDTNMVINHVEHFRRVTPIKPRRFGVGIQAGWHYAPSVKAFTPTVGVGISYNLFNF